MKTEAILQCDLLGREEEPAPRGAGAIGSAPPGNDGQMKRLRLVVPRELAWKLRLLRGEGDVRRYAAPPEPRVLAWHLAKIKNIRKKLDGTLRLVHLGATDKRNTMPNAHSPDKEPLSMQIPRTLMGRLKLKARRMGMSVPNYVTTILTHETKEITLTSNDYEAIARATRQAERTGRRCATRFDDPA